MNRVFSAPQQSLPDVIEDYLEDGKASCFTFNRHGTLLVVGTTTGSVVLWGFRWRSVIFKIQAHHKRITSVVCGFPKTGQYLWSASMDGTVKLWDTVAEGEIGCGQHERIEEQLATTCLKVCVRTHQAVVSCVAYPAQSRIVAVCPVSGFPYLIKADTDGEFELHEISHVLIQTPTERSLAASACLKPDPPSESPLASPRNSESIHVDSAASPTMSPSHSSLGTGFDPKLKFCVAFSDQGDMLLRGSTNGIVSLFSCLPDAKLEFVRNYEMPGKAGVKDIVFDSKSKFWAANCTDRTVRLFLVGTLVSDIEQKRGACSSLPMVSMEKAADVSVAKLSSLNLVDSVIQPICNIVDVINRVPWQSVSFSPDSDYIALGLQDNSNKISIYLTDYLQIKQVLEGPREGMGGVLWHPLRDTIVSIGADFGGIYVWGRQYAENWSAYAADFKEVEENSIYLEPEIAFDKKGVESKEGENDDYIDIESYDPTQTLNGMFPDTPLITFRSMSLSAASVKEDEMLVDSKPPAKRERPVGSSAAVRT